MFKYNYFLWCSLAYPRWKTLRRSSSSPFFDFKRKPHVMVRFNFLFCFHSCSFFFFFFLENNLELPGSSADQDLTKNQETKLNPPRGQARRPFGLSPPNHHCNSRNLLHSFPHRFRKTLPKNHERIQSPTL